ncbi:hypothetical protein BTJ40_04930 [Microbulbifer sp. A4B17]|uniref:hypothetical protein n=1 Tax=Microbulbifer sp. A4B17 TaxID=359370 RepID=UPI000D52D146|nr:hypothetical protein [Microbulbifer sp. A4B17]AWF80205.1 hypothetical protein BTJ40_04930 [Microbulbifer sp. A4B17]
MKNSEYILSLNNESSLSAEYCGAVKFFDSNEFLRTLEALDSSIEVLFSSAPLMIKRLKRHSEHEKSGSDFIRMVSRNIHIGDTLRKELTEHANDELKHSRMFNALIKHFETINDYHSRYEYEYDTDSDVEKFMGDVDLFLISTHCAELRNLFILNGYLVQEKCGGMAFPSSFYPAIHEIHKDEIRHVVYTQAYVSKLASNPELLRYFKFCLEDYEELLLKEVSISIAAIPENETK